ncbi:translocase of chloroplast 159, chloroplastic [Salvia miltiorrhiza]|uniref:translocase of chloroplast 159, chloroplastic n=1 Tax=Salvia miltiorrhiza TaxID=226208 RepID=UPI0025ABCD76|nr:translocase of chloroplast 159, chloroplastic [Salvia miltiorrhiza]
MGSSIHGVPLPGAQMGRSDSSVSGIRAPLTVDDSDFESSVSSKSRSYYSGSELEDFEGGEDMLEVSGVVEEDEGIVEETDIVNEFVVSGDAVVGLSGEVVEGSSSNERKFVQESGSVGGMGVFRPLSRYPSGKIYKGVGDFDDDSDDSGSLLSESSDDELVEKEKNGAKLGSSRPIVAVVDEEAEEVEEGEFTPVMGTRVLSARKLAIPVAKISGDSDDDSYGSGVSEEEGFSGVARVPGIKVLHRIVSAPKVRMVESDDEGDENESQGEYVVEMELVGDLLDEKEPIVVENSLVQYNGLDFNEQTMAHSLAVDKEFNPTSESRHNGGLIHMDEDIKEVDVVEDRKECLELVGFREAADFAESIVLPEISCVASVAEAAASPGDMDCKSSNNGLEDDCIFNQIYESENVEKMKQGIEQTVESFRSNADHEISSAHQCVDINEDASSISAVAASQFVFEDSKLEEETGKEVEASELLPSDVEESSFYSDNKAEMDVVQDSTTPHTIGVLLDHSEEIDSEVLEDFHDEVDADGGMSNGTRMIDPAVLAALFEAVRSAASDDDVIKVVSIDGVENLSPGIAARTHGVNPSSTNVEALSEREKVSIKKIQNIRVKYLRLLERLGRSPEDSVAAKVLHQLTLAAGSSHSLEFHLDSIKSAAMELEAQTKDNSDFPLSVLIIGKTGVGKSATVNSIVGESSAVVDAFEPATACVREITGLINGVKLKIFDTPGLRASLIDQSINRKILSSIKKVMKKSPPDVVLYVDRLDTRRGDLDDLPLLRLVTSCLGSSIWRKSIVTFTHGAAVPPDGPDGYPISHEAFVAQQSQVVQRLICHSAGEAEPLVMNSDSVLPVCVIENAERNGHGETVLHNGERWRSQLLLLCCSMKILSEVSSVVATRSPLDCGEPFGLLSRSPPLSHYLSSFLKSNVHPELSSDQSGDIVGSDVEHDNLAPFKPLNASRIAKLSRDQREAYREGEDLESGVVPLADMALPPSFDGDEPSFRYRVSEPSSRLLTRPVLTPHGWDHDCSYNGLLIEDRINIANGLPAIISAQLTSDKNEFKIQLHSSKHGGKGSIKGEAKIKNFRKHRAATIKVEDRVAVGERAYCVNLFFNQDESSMGISAMRCGDEVVYGCNVNSCISINRGSKLGITAALDNRLRGKICIKTSCSDQLQIAALALVPIARAVIKRFLRQPGED